MNMQILERWLDAGTMQKVREFDPPLTLKELYDYTNTRWAFHKGTVEQHRDCVMDMGMRFGDIITTFNDEHILPESYRPSQSDGENFLPVTYEEWLVLRELEAFRANPINCARREWIFSQIPKAQELRIAILWNAIAHGHLWLIPFSLASNIPLRTMIIPREGEPMGGVIHMP